MLILNPALPLSSRWRHCVKSCLVLLLFWRLMMPKRGNKELNLLKKSKGLRSKAMSADSVQWSWSKESGLSSSSKKCSHLQSHRCCSSKEVYCFREEHCHWSTIPVWALQIAQRFMSLPRTSTSSKRRNSSRTLIHTYVPLTQDELEALDFEARDSVMCNMLRRHEGYDQYNSVSNQTSLSKENWNSKPYLRREWSSD